MRLCETGCLTLIGMAGAGKSTLAPLLAQRLSLAHMDTDRLVEAWFGRCLQDVLDTLGEEEFLAQEELVVSKLAVTRCVISTGGSVVYGPRAMETLRGLGPVVYLEIDEPTLRQRLGDAVGRGFVARGGKDLAAVFAERRELYARYADLAVPTHCLTPEQCVERIATWLELPEPDMSADLPDMKGSGTS